jgi:hypothetical protein
MQTFKINKLLIAVALFIALTCCRKSELAPLTQQGALSQDIQQFSTNGAVTYNYQTDIDLTAPGWDEINSCTGEHLNITSGIWHFVMHGMYSDHAFLMSIHNNTEYYKVVSLETGIEYSGNSEWNGHYSFPLSNPNSFTLTIVNNVVLTTAGGGNNSKYFADLHMTVDATGKLTVSIDRLRAGCQ